MNKIKVVWVCHLSNPQIRQRLTFERWTLLALLRKILHTPPINDFAIWNTKAIREFEKYKDIELHIVAPHYCISGIQEFDINGIHYHFFKSEDDNLFHIIKKKISKSFKHSYKQNSKKINRFIAKIHPDIIHMIGAENPYYGEAALIMPKSIPLIVTLQTLMSDPDFEKNYPISHQAYTYRSKVESAIIRRASYIGTTIIHFRNIILNQVCPTAIFLDMDLAVGEDLDITNYEKIYDFVYYAADISKAIDYALEAFAIAQKQYPHITLHVVGGYDVSSMIAVEKLMQQLGLEQGITFTGKLATHEDVIHEIQKARFALLPLKIDLISTTIREAMSLRLPVITTITPLTPNLNQNRESVLLSKKGDFSAMAHNMCKVITDSTLAHKLSKNALQTIKETYDNAIFMQKWRNIYLDIINHHE